MSTELQENDLKVTNIPHLARRKFKSVTFQDESGDWRHKIKRVRNEFNDIAKGEFLKAYEMCGRMGDSAIYAGVSVGTVRKAMEKDPDFAEACTEAEQTYRDALHDHVQNLIFNGTTKITYDKNGNIVNEEKIYPIKLIEMEMKRWMKEYRDKQQIDITHKGGVMIAPPALSIEDWQKKYAKKSEEAKPVAGKVIELTDKEEMKDSDSVGVSAAGIDRQGENENE